MSQAAKIARSLSVPSKDASFSPAASASTYAAYLHALIENCPVAIAVLDAQHQFQMCNPAFVELFQYSREELKANHIDRLIATPELVMEAASITQRVLHGENVHAVSRRRRKDGSEIDVEVYGVPLIVDGKLQGVYGLYQDITERNRAETALRQLSGRFLQVQDEERRKIARDLHDTTAQELAALNLNLGRLERMLGDSSPGIQSVLARTIDLANQCAREIRSASYLLHPPLLEEIGLRAAIDAFCDGFRQRTGMRVDLRLPRSSPRLSIEAEAALFRVIQESLANVLRHSGSAEVRIELKKTRDSLAAVITDRGHGLPEHPHGDGVGLRGMRERIEQLGGSFAVQSGPRGTRVVAKLPLGA